MTVSRVLLEVDELVKDYRIGHGRHVRVVPAVRGISFTIEAGETLALVGESGCGKSTTARCIVGLDAPTAGRVRFDGVDPTTSDRPQRRGMRRRVQIVFQDPYSSLDPRMTVSEIVREPLSAHRVGTRPEQRARVLELLDDVGLGTEHVARYPHELSGGQRQRVAIARALALSPELLVLDEPVSALDVSVRAQVVNLLARLQRTHGLAYLFIAHDLAVVRHVARRVGVMYLGSIVELGTRQQVYEQPRHPYTAALLAAVPTMEPGPRRRRVAVAGDVPSPTAGDPGCPFATRCWKTQAVCRTERPPLRADDDGHAVACHFPLERDPLEPAPRLPTGAST